MTAMIRDWASVDYYAELGVAASASDEEIGRAFRGLAKTLHPDRFGDASAEAERFKLVTAAYEVLSDPGLRADYDRIDRERHNANGVRVRPAQPMGSVPRIPDAPMIRWTPWKAMAAIVAGVVFMLLGVATAIVMIVIHSNEASEANGRIKVVATVAHSPSGDARLLFVDQAGTSIETAVPKLSNPRVLRDGDRVTVLYRYARSSDIIADEPHFGRDFTIWFVAVKFFFGGPIVTITGLRRRRALLLRNAQ